MAEEQNSRKTSDARAEISRNMVRLHAEYYGRGPTKAKTYISGDLVAVILEETFTRAERTLMGHGDADAIQQIRRRFQQRMGDQFKSLVEQATGRTVRAFLSDTNLDADVAVEIFLLAEERTDMTAFEEASGEEGTG
ncbi:MAG: hypothetical protein QOK04_2760 [Solirubrobacteraceae bacterium]|jgi:uncharacterized protein YbcI|nr:hypothetical protein [Solirubrobacteraceae bacterium]